jgi:ketosteroid isomerase-like protein
VVGLDAIAEMWEAEREGPDEVFHLNYEIVAVDPAESVAVVRLDVEYGEPVEQEWADLWVVRFAPDGRCAAFEEWPFAPSE